jgi:prepilin-type N-terminal cleavage/methylation domain-containing protein
MSTLSRRGFTLVELLVALVLLSIVSASLYKVLVNNQRMYQSQTQRIDLQSNLRAAQSILPADLREVDATEGDITAASATSITFRAMRWLGFICNLPVTGGGLQNPVLAINLTNKKMFYIRFPAAGDSVLIRYEGDEGTRNDDSWVRGVVTATGTLNCAGTPVYPDNSAGRLLTVSASMLAADSGPVIRTPNVVNSIYAGAPVRGFMSVTYGLYMPPGDTSWYVGMRSGTNAVQPLIGPVLSNGLELAYFDSSGTQLATPLSGADLLRVMRVTVTVRARTAQPVRRASGGTLLGSVIDSTVARVALRNNRRF